MIDDDDGLVLTRWQRFVIFNPFMARLGYWILCIDHKRMRAYDELMIRFWPYERYPREWHDLFSRGADVPRETSKE